MLPRRRIATAAEPFVIEQVREHALRTEGAEVEILLERSAEICG